MPMFATLCGNDLIDWEDLRQFQRTIVRHPQAKFKYIANFVSMKFPFTEQLKTYGECEYLNKIPTCKPSREQLLASLRSYDISYENSDESLITQFAAGLPYACLILKDIPQTLSLNICDMRSPELLDVHVLYIPLVERNMGVVLFHQTDRPTHRRIRTRLSHTDSAFCELALQPEYPKCKSYRVNTFCS